MNIIQSAIKTAGGQTKVGSACKRKPPSVHKWGQLGLPRSENSGETKYTEIIVKMANRNLEKGKPKYTKKQLLDASADLRQARSS